MTPKQKRFCDEYLIDCNATEAAKRAGYKGETCKNASRWLDPNSTEKYNVEMHQYIQDRLAEMESETIANATEVMQYLTSVMRGESKSSVLALCGDGCQEVIRKAPDEKEKLKAAEMLAKRYGLLTEKLTVDGNIPVVIVDDVDEEE